VTSSCDLQEFGPRRKTKQWFKSLEPIGVKRDSVVLG